MSRWFHAIAAALFLVALWTDLGRAPPRPAADPKVQLIGLLARSGLGYAGERPLPEGGSVLSFRLAACPLDAELIYLPSLSRITPAALAAIEAGGAKMTFVHDGEAVAGLGPLDLMPRWAWRKLLASARIGRSEAWQSIALAWLVPRACAAPRIDWRALTR